MNAALSISLLAMVLPVSAILADDSQHREPIPVVYISDIGDDIDDTWALGFLLKCPELDLKMVATDQGRPEFRARLFARLLEIAGRTDVPIALGPDENLHGDGRQADWVKDYALSSYPGTVHEDGVQALVDLIMKSETPITVIAVGPVPTVAAMLAREPRIAERARFVGMHGSVHRGYGGSDKISAEYNVAADVASCRAAFAAPWPITITPLDTCGIVHLEGDPYQRVLKSDDPVAQAVIENYRVWARNHDRFEDPTEMLATRSSTLYDTVAVLMAFHEDWLIFEDLKIRVSDDGLTVIDPEEGRSMRVATRWKDLDAFRAFLVDRLNSPTVPARGR